MPQLDFRDEAENLRKFRRHFASAFWRAIVSFPQPVDDLVSQHVVVETFERGESVADYLHKAGDSPKVTKWRLEGDKWVPVDPSQALEAAFTGQTHLTEKVNAKDDDKRDGDDIELRKKVALCGVQSYLKMLMMDNFIHADLHPYRRKEPNPVHCCAAETPAFAPLWWQGQCPRAYGGGGLDRAAAAMDAHRPIRLARASYSIP